MENLVRKWEKQQGERIKSEWDKGGRETEREKERQRGRERSIQWEGKKEERKRGREREGQKEVKT